MLAVIFERGINTFSEVELGARNVKYSGSSDKKEPSPGNSTECVDILLQVTGRNNHSSHYIFSLFKQHNPACVCMYVHVDGCEF